MHLAERLTATITQPYRVGDIVISIGISIGATTALPHDDVDSVLRHADTLMYQRKARQSDMA